MPQLLRLRILIASATHYAGEIGDRFFIIESGEVTVEERRGSSATASEGTRGSRDVSIRNHAMPGDDEDAPRLLTRLYPGNHFGEISLVRAQPRVASVVARRGQVICRVLSKAAFDNLVSLDPAYSDVIAALTRETDAMRRKRDAARAAAGGFGLSTTSKVAFVSSNVDNAKVTHSVRVGFNAQRQATVNNYTLLRTLGSGTYGRVFLASDTTAGGRPFAIKVIASTYALHSSCHQSSSSFTHVAQLTVGQMLLPSLSGGR